MSITVDIQPAAGRSVIKLLRFSTDQPHDAAIIIYYLMIFAGPGDLTHAHSGFKIQSNRHYHLQAGEKYVYTQREGGKTRHSSQLLAV